MNIGPHRLLCGDVTDGAVAHLMGDERADVIYSDPPWGPHMLVSFAGMAGGSPRASWPEFLRAFCEACATHRKSDAPVFVEMGLRWVYELDEAMLAVGLREVWRRQILYGPKKKPIANALTLYGPRDVPVDLPDPPYGDAVTRAVLTAAVHAGDIVLDPCTGLGLTAKVAYALGCRFRGTELVPDRLERTADWLRRKVR